MKKISVILVAFFLTFNIYAQNDIEEAKELYYNGYVNESLQKMKELYSTYPQNLEVNYFLGLAFIDIGDFESSEKFLQFVYGKDSKYKYVCSELTYLYLMIGDLDKAVKYGKESVKYYPEYFEGYINLCTTLRLQGKNSEFNKYLKKAAKINFNSATVLADSLLVENNRPELALMYYKVLEGLKPSHPHILYNTAMAYKMLKDIDNYNKYLKKAYYNAAPNMPELPEYFAVYANYMWSLINTNKYKQIKKDAFLNCGKDYPDAYYYLAIADYCLNDMNGFEKNAEKYFDLKNEEKPANYEEWILKILHKK